jgi:chorismate dehydratase
MPKRLGIPGDSYLRPLFNGLRGETREGDLQVIEASPAELALQLRQGELDGAFLSPIDYAKDYSDYKIVPQVACSSSGPSGIVSLLFNEQLFSLRTVAVDPRYTSEIVLMHLILVEKYDIVPQIVPAGGSVDDLLKTHDAVLVTGAAAEQMSGRKNKIDLVDEWTDLTGMPFVHGFWTVNEGLPGNFELDILALSPPPVAPQIEGIQVEEDGSFVPRIDFAFGADVAEALNEFYRMAYYHGILKDLPDLRFPTPAGP